jgi:hypothetical protein
MDKAFFVRPTRVSSGPLRLVPTQFLLEGDEPASTFLSSDEHGGPRNVLVYAVGVVAAALDSILTAFALARRSV